MALTVNSLFLLLRRPLMSFFIHGLFLQQLGRLLWTSTTLFHRSKCSLRCTEQNLLYFSAVVLCPQCFHTSTVNVCYALSSIWMGALVSSLKNGMIMSALDELYFVFAPCQRTLISSEQTVNYFSSTVVTECTIVIFRLYNLLWKIYTMNISAWYTVLELLNCLFTFCVTFHSCNALQCIMEAFLYLFMGTLEILCVSLWHDRSEGFLDIIHPYVTTDICAKLCFSQM